MTDPWDRLARFRDERSGETGDLWHRALIDPALRELVGPVRGLRLLEVGCGNGYLARRFAREGAGPVVGVDRSAATIARARARERAAPEGVDFRVADASALPFAPDSFDLVVMNMALMDIRDAAGAIGEAARVLAPDGRLVFSINHPCFDIDEHSGWLVESGDDPRQGRRERVYRKVHNYRAERAVRVPWRVDARTVLTTTAYHRTLSTYASLLQRGGFAIGRLAEPSPRPELRASAAEGRYLAEVPLHLVVEAVRRRGATAPSRTPERSRARAARRSGSRARRHGTGSPRRGASRGS